MGNGEKVISFRDVGVVFHMSDLAITALEGIDLDVMQGEVLGILGESGSGKTVLLHTALRLLPDNASVMGTIRYGSVDLLGLEIGKARSMIGRHFSLIPQSYSSLNPSLRMWLQIAEQPMEHLGLHRKGAEVLAEGLLSKLDLPNSRQAIHYYRHQLSGGGRQRVLVAMGMSAEPQVIFIDEPTKGIDANKKTLVTSLLKKLRSESGPTMIIVSHDLDFLEAISDRVCVMYCGDILEVSRKRDFFESPLHPYSRALLESLPSNGLKPIEGKPPSMASHPPGCRFHPRCREAKECCSHARPDMVNVNGNMVRCMKYGK